MINKKGGRFIYRLIIHPLPRNRSERFEYSQSKPDHLGHTETLGTVLDNPSRRGLVIQTTLTRAPPGKAVNVNVVVACVEN